MLIVRELLADPPQGVLGVLVSELEYINTVLGCSPVQQKLEYIFENVQYDGVLQRWAPNSGFVAVLPFAHVERSFSGMEPEEFWKGAQQILSAEAVIDKIPHSVVKYAMGEMVKLNTTISAHQIDMVGFAKHASLEIAAVKLGIEKMGRHEFAEHINALKLDTLRALQKLLGKADPKHVAVDVTIAGAVACALRAVEAAEKASAAEKAQKMDVEKQAVEQTGHEISAPAKEGSAGTIVAGKLVMISVRKNKSNFEQKRGIVINAKSQKAKVLLLEGPQKDVEKEFSYDSLTLIDEKNEKPGQAKDDNSKQLEDKEDSAVTKKAVECELFGDVSDV